MTDKNKEALLPCPFCGSKPKLGSLGGDKENWCVWCADCGGGCFETSYDEPSKEVMLNKWNTRAALWNTRAALTEQVHPVDLAIKQLKEYGGEVKYLAVRGDGTVHTLEDLPAVPVGAQGGASNTEKDRVMEGWKLVPEEPTHEMTGMLLAPCEDRTDIVRIYKAMLAAAPKPPVEEQ